MLQMNGPKQSGAQVHCNLNPAVQETQILGNIQDTNISVTSRTSGEGFPYALPKLVVVTAAYALVTLRERAGLDLGRKSARSHDTLAIREVEDPPREHLDLALTVASFRVLVRVGL